MTHDEAFAEFVARKREQEAATVKVTWRKVSPMTGGGWSGLGPDGALVFVDDTDTGEYHFGTRDGKVKTIKGTVKSLPLAKRAAERLLERDR